MTIHNLKKVIAIGIFVFFSLLGFSNSVFAQEHLEELETYKGKVLESVVVDCDDISGESEFICVKYSVEILDGDRKNDSVETLISAVNSEADFFKKGKIVYLSLYSSEELGDQWNIESYSREGQLLFLLLIFVVLILLVTGFRGIKAVLGLVLSFIVIYFVAIPNINSTLNGNILPIAILTVFLLLIASTFVTYGFNRKSLIAFISSILGVIFIFCVGFVVVKALDISGTGEESAVMLYDTISKSFSLSSIYLLGIVIGALGVLDDVTIGQVSSMMEIYQTDSSLTSKVLYRKAMNIGKDHIASMINTLFIAYAGSSFTLVILLAANNPNFRILINTEFLVEEIVRTLVASICLILVVPVTTYISSIVLVKMKNL